MNVACHTGIWGGVTAHPAGVTSIKDLHYLSPGSEKEALTAVAAAGYDGFELFDGNLHRYADEPGTLGGLARDLGLQLVAVYCGAGFVFPAAEEDELWRIEQTALLAARLGARFLNIGGGAIRSRGRQLGDLTALARGLTRVAQLAARHGLVATYHPHAGTLCATPEDLAEITQLTEIALCPDTAHVLADGGDPVQVISTYRDRIPYVHLKDYRAGLGYVPLGEGDVDLRGVVEALGVSHEDTWWTVELDSTDGDPAPVVRRNRETLEALIHEVGAART